MHLTERFGPRRTHILHRTLIRVPKFLTGCWAPAAFVTAQFVLRRIYNRTCTEAVFNAFARTELWGTRRFWFASKARRFRKMDDIGAAFPNGPAGSYPFRKVFPLVCFGC